MALENQTVEALRFLVPIPLTVNERHISWNVPDGILQILPWNESLANRVIVSGWRGPARIQGLQAELG